MEFKRKDLLGTRDLSAVEIRTLLESAESFKEIAERPLKKVPALRGKTVVNLFFEPSTRTRTSFEIAAKRLSADAVNMSASTSSVVKGESLLDTVYNIQAMAPDIIVVRHKYVGAAHLIAGRIGASVVNAGDGANEHPTQALLDLLTIAEAGTILYAAFFIIEKQNLIDALIAAKVRGVDVRIITDNRYYTSVNYKEGYDLLEAAGIPVKTEWKNFA